MKTKIIWATLYYSYYIVWGLFIIYLLFFSMFLKGLSVYYTYVMIFLGGLLLGYYIANTAYRYLKKHPREDK